MGLAVVEAIAQSTLRTLSVPTYLRTALLPVYALCLFLCFGLTRPAVNLQFHMQYFAACGKFAAKKSSRLLMLRCFQGV